MCDQSMFFFCDLQGSRQQFLIFLLLINVLVKTLLYDSDVFSNKRNNQLF